MLCLKCGREIEPEQTFCAGCLAEMEKYPVKPGTVVTIPQRPASTPAKKSGGRRRAPVPAEEQVKRLKKRLTAACVALALSVTVLIGLCAMLAAQYISNPDKLLPGQNYSSATTQPETER